MKKSRWVRIDLATILKDKDLLKEMLEKRKSGDYWPYRSDQNIKWKLI